MAESKKENEAAMSFLEHLAELRIRLIRSFIALVVCVLATYGYRKEILDIFRQPIEAPLKKYAPEASMVFLSVPEVFFAQLKIALFSGIFLSFPYLIIEIWGFVSPALFKEEKRIFWPFAIFTYLFFTGGALFGYFIVFPFGFDFFLSLTQPNEIMPSLSIGSYLIFTLKLLLAFGFVFELPLIAFVLARMGILTPEWLIKNAKYALLSSFIVAAILTPPDPFTMFLMAGPLILLYGLSIIVSFVAVNRKKAAQRAQGL